MKLKSLTSIVLFIGLSCNAIGQTSSKLEIYKDIKGTTKFFEMSISKEEFLKIDSLIVDPKDSSWFEYTIVLTGKGKDLRYRQVSGRVIKIDSQIQQWVKETDDCVVTIDDVRILTNAGYKYYPSVNISVK